MFNSSMNLFTLHLHADLAYTGSSPETKGFFDPEEALKGVVDLKSGTERLIAFHKEDILTNTSNGPKAKEEFGKAIFAGFAVKPEENQNTLILKKGDYLFTQSTYKDFASIKNTIESFERDIWWEKQKTEGPYYIRLVPEDGKTALQILAKTV